MKTTPVMAFIIARHRRGLILNLDKGKYFFSLPTATPVMPTPPMTDQRSLVDAPWKPSLVRLCTQHPSDKQTRHRQLERPAIHHGSTWGIA